MVTYTDKQIQAMVEDARKDAGGDYVLSWELRFTPGTNDISLLVWVMKNRQQVSWAVAI